MGVKNIWFSFKRNIWYLWNKKSYKKQVNEYKMTKREIYKKFTNLSEKELNTQNNKNRHVRNDVMTTIIKRWRGEQKRDIKAIDGFRKKINDSRFWNSYVSRIWNQIKNREIFSKNIISLKNILLRFRKLILIFMNIMKKKYKLIKMSVNIFYLELMFIFKKFY